MNLKRRWLLIRIIVLVSCGILAYHLLATPRSTLYATSPDGRYVATVHSAFPPLGDYSYEIEVKRTDWEKISHLVVDDKPFGWPREPTINWTTDSSTVTVGLRDGDTDGEGNLPSARKRISIDVR